MTLHELKPPPCADGDRVRVTNGSSGPWLKPLTKSAAEIEQEAAAWLVRVDAGATGDISNSLTTWLNESPRHRASFIRLSAAWQRADVLRRLAAPDAVPDQDLLRSGRLP